MNALSLITIFPPEGNPSVKLVDATTSTEKEPHNKAQKEKGLSTRILLSRHLS